ncbi:MAG: leucyl aminopeptidase family protein [Gammaproteobacteria bacterium]
MPAESFFADPSAGACPVHLVDRENLSAVLAELPEAHRSWVRAQAWEPKPGDVLGLPGSKGNLSAVLAGIGGAEPFWNAAAIPGRLPPGTYALAGEPEPGEARRLAIAWGVGQYAFRRYRKDPAPPVRRLVWPEGVDADAVRSAVEADALVRDLVNTPAADMGPEDLAKSAAALAASHGADFREVVGEALLAENFPAIHAVGRASDRAPRLVELNWGESDRPRVTLVGKGVCFDSGGLNLKPAQGMRNMKKDMGGAAHVLGLARMVMDARLPLRLRVLIPAVENSVSGNAYRPGDVVATRAGLTVEIGNTDAEGRMVLADALALADEDHPEVLLDFATLTGAARVALGPDLPALYSDSDDVSGELAAAGVDDGDPLWPMPLWAPYDDNLCSAVADMNNIAPDGFAGSIYGGLFLKRFVKHAEAWAHVDVFAWNPKNRSGRPEGGMAQGVRAVFAWLADRYPAEGD